MAETDEDLGRRFSQVYLTKGEPQKDSQRARTRLASAVHRHASHLLDRVKADIVKELGINGPVYPDREHAWRDWLSKVELRDVLDVPTIVVGVIDRFGRGHSPNEFIAEVNRIFGEENLGYRLDWKGGVRYFQDEEFERSRAAAITGLAAPKYQAAAEAFEDAHAALAGAAPDTLTAVRRAFDAAENVFKMAFVEARLGAGELTKKLTPLLAQKYPGRSANAAKLNAKAFAEWVNACHSYRHAPGEPDPSPPPMDLAVSLVSGAANYLRWLIVLDSQSNN